jgi:hypothetical protein
MTTRIGPTETFVFRLFTTNPPASPGRAWTRSSSPRPGLGATVRQELALGIAANARQVVLTESFHELVRCRGGYRRLLSESCKSDRTETCRSDSDD